MDTVLHGLATLLGPALLTLATALGVKLSLRLSAFLKAHEDAAKGRTLQSHALAVLEVAANMVADSFSRIQVDIAPELKAMLADGTLSADERTKLVVDMKTLAVSQLKKAIPALVAAAGISELESMVGAMAEAFIGRVLSGASAASAPAAASVALPAPQPPAPDPSAP